MALEDMAATALHDATDTAEAAVNVASAAHYYPRWFPPKSAIPKDHDARVEVLLTALVRFVQEGCRTLDEHADDDEEAIRPIPLEEMPYLYTYLGLCVSERKIIVPKSRQIMMTWVTFCYVLWRMLFRPFQKYAWIPKKEEDGHRHVEERLKTILWGFLPEWLTSQFTVAKVKGHFVLETFQGKLWNSQLLVYPQGSDQTRQYTHSGVIVDEAAHQIKLDEMWKGMVPTTHVRGAHLNQQKKTTTGSRAGQIFLISSAKKGSYMQKLCGPELREAVRRAKEPLVRSLTP